MSLFSLNMLRRKHVEAAGGFLSRKLSNTVVLNSLKELPESTHTISFLMPGKYQCKLVLPETVPTGFHNRKWNKKKGPFLKSLSFGWPKSSLWRQLLSVAWSVLFPASTWELGSPIIIAISPYPEEVMGKGVRGQGSRERRWQRTGVSPFHFPVDLPPPC